jgi:hypothetical protein
MPGVNLFDISVAVGVARPCRKTETTNSFAVRIRESNGKNMAEIRVLTVCER